MERVTLISMLQLIYTLHMDQIHKLSTIYLGITSEQASLSTVFENVLIYLCIV